MQKYLVTMLMAVMLLPPLIIHAQSNQQLAKDKGQQAVQLEDEGKFDEALKLLDEAQKLDPDNITYPYEATYAYYSQKKYDKVINLLGKLKDRPDSFDRLYQLLGNSYDVTGKTQKAIAVYDEGISKFPNSGCLYLERGIIPLGDKDYNQAIKYFEKGIEVQPNFPSNYYWAAKLYCGSDNEMWGMMYGELFMNLEPNSARTAEISKLLYDTYKNQITFISPEKVSVSFSKSATILIDDLKTLKLPYGLIYEPTLSMAIASEKSIDLNSLNRIRKSFIDAYYQREYDKKYPNVLFDYQNQLLKAGQLEAYNYWLLMKGDENAFLAWQQTDKAKWESFVAYMRSNPLQLNAAHRFHRLQY